MNHFVTTFPLRFSSKTSSDIFPANSLSDSFPFSVAVDESGAVVATAFGGLIQLGQRLALERPIEDHRRTALAREQIEGFFAGELRTFSLRLAPRGSVYQHRVWAALQRIPFGETRSYGQLADQLASSPRAVGRANATNPICLVIPCHRVIGADGSLTGFAFGEDIKRQLLGHEAHFRNVRVCTAAEV